MRTQPDGELNISASVSAYRELLAAGADPRAWEPFGSSRHGESVDVITDHTTTIARMNAGALPYKIVVLSLTDPPEGDLQSGIEAFVRSGGAVVLSVEHLTQASALSLAGCRLSGRHSIATSTTWNGTQLSEATFNYSVVVPTTAQVVAVTELGDPIVLRNGLGSSGGAVYTVTAQYMGAPRVGGAVLNTLSDSL